MILDKFLRAVILLHPRSQKFCLQSCGFTTPTYNMYINHFIFLQLRQLVDECINPDPEKRPDITFVSEVARRMYNESTQQAPSTS